MVGRVRESEDDNFGFNAETGEFCDLIKAGVIDPAKVTRLALQNAALSSLMPRPLEVLIAEDTGTGSGRCRPRKRLLSFGQNAVRYSWEILTFLRFYK